MVSDIFGARHFETILIYQIFECQMYKASDRTACTHQIIKLANYLTITLWIPMRVLFKFTTQQWALIIVLYKYSTEILCWWNYFSKIIIKILPLATKSRWWYKIIFHNNYIVYSHCIILVFNHHSIENRRSKTCI